MKFPRRLFRYVLAAEVFALPLISSVPKAQDYPTRPEKLIVPYAAGSPTDVWARPVAQKLSEHFGRQTVCSFLDGGRGGSSTL
jgi:tripartite-type tricarboxylate transporter receptor subunit TctC